METNLRLASVLIVRRSSIQGKIVVGSSGSSAVLTELQPSSRMFVLSSENVRQK